MEDNANKPNPGAGKPNPESGTPSGGSTPTGNQAGKSPDSKPTGAPKPAENKPAAAGSGAPQSAPAGTDSKKPNVKQDPKAAKPGKPEKKQRPPKEPKEKKKRGGTIILLILTLLMAGGAGTMGYLYYEKNKEQGETSVELDTKKQEAIQLQKQVEAMIDSIDIKKAEIRSLTSDTIRLFNQLDSVKLAYQKLRRSSGWAFQQANEYKKFKAEYTLLLQQQDSELLKLRAIRDEQMKNITELKTTVAEKETIISEKEQVIEEQSETIKDGQVLAAADFKAYAINSKGKTKFDLKEKGYKSKDLDKLKVDFSVAPNKIAEENVKTYYMVLKEPSGVGLSGNLAGGTFKDINGKTLYFASKKDDTYSRSGKTLSVVYDKEPSYEFKAGNNIIEIYCEGHMIGSGSFLVK